MKVLNKAQVDALFQHEAVLIGTEDAVPVFRAAALFGERAAKYAQNCSDEQCWGGYGVGDYTLMYLTLRGFRTAASFYNVMQLRTEAQHEQDQGPV